MVSEEIQFKAPRPPRDPEKISESERIKRIHGFVGQIYDRVCLNGDWMRDDERASSSMRKMEGKPINDPVEFALALQGLITEISRSVRPIQSGTILDSDNKRNDANRIHFVDSLKSISTILKDKTYVDKRQSDLLNALNNSMHYFVDMPDQVLPKENQTYSQVDEIEKTKQGLLELNQALSDIVVQMPWKDLPPEAAK